jgi:hypothetical protein
MDRTTRATQLVVAVDDDDPKLPEYQAIDYGGFAVLAVVPRSTFPPPGRLAQVFNWVAVFYAARHPFTGSIGDDHRPRTMGWDARLMEVLDRPGVSYGNDLLQGANLPTECVISSEIIRAIGYMCPETIEHLFLDNFWKQLGISAGNLVYLGDVIIEHMHAANGKAPWDDGYRESLSQELMAKDGQRYQEFLAGPWQQDRPKVEALRDWQFK